MSEVDSVLSLLFGKKKKRRSAKKIFQERAVSVRKKIFQKSPSRRKSKRKPAKKATKKFHLL